MGLGDAKLLLLAGAWFGWPVPIFALLVGAAQGTCVAVAVYAAIGIVTDLRMPGASGLEVLSRLRIVGCATPVIMMTAFPDERVRKEAGVLNSMLLAKPFELESLRYAVRFYTDLGRRHSKS